MSSMLEINFTRALSSTNSTMPLPHDNAVALYAALSLVLLVARLMGELAKKLGQPVVMGELLAGVLLGRTVLYQISPKTFNYLFTDGKTASAFAGVTSLCVTMYMLTAGLEMSMRNAMKKRNAALSVGLLSLIIPFVLGFITAYVNPPLMGAPPGADVTNYALFTGTAMAITALPVAAKTLRDLHLYRTELGVVVISAAVLDDVLGWTLFAIVLSLAAQYSSSSLGLVGGIVVSIVYVIATLTLGAWIVNKILPYIQAYLSFPAGELGFVCLFALSSATFALYVGLHNTLGAFIAGAAIGNSRHFRPDMRDTLDTFVTFMLAPIFFGSVAIRANFASDFDPPVVFLVFFVSCAGKLLGGFIGARLVHTGFRESAAIAVCMNARGAMELILASVAVEAKVIDGKMFVALVFMAIVTSLMPGPLLRRILRRPRVVTMSSYVHEYGFAPKLAAESMQEAVKELCYMLGHAEYAGPIIEAELDRSSVANYYVAIPHARVSNAKEPTIAIGISQEGIVFPSGLPVKFIVVVAIPEGSDIELDLIRDIDMLFSSESFLSELATMKSGIELKALLQIHKYRLDVASEHLPAYINAPIVETPTGGKDNILTGLPEKMFFIDEHPSLPIREGVNIELELNRADSFVPVKPSRKSTSLGPAPSSFVNIAPQDGAATKIQPDDKDQLGNV